MEAERPIGNLFVRHATEIALVTLTVLMMLAAGAFWRQEDVSWQAKGWVIHTYDVKTHIESLFSSLVDVEVGQRGYLLTGDADYLDPYHEALRNGPKLTAENLTARQHRSISQELAVIRTLTKDNPAQQSNLDEMDEVAGRLLTYAKSTIHQQQIQGANAVGPKIDLRHGRELMDHIRSLVRIMEAEESHLLDLRSEADEISTNQDAWMTFLSLAFFYVAMASAVFFYQRSQARGRSQLLLYTEELEKREEELKMQQEELKTSNEEIEAANEELEEKTKALEQQNAQILQQAAELSESKRLTEEKAREVERASKYKSEFLANMSHELRTPLNSLLILARLLAANEQGNLTDEQVEEARVIHNGGLELLGLINDILDLSKVEAGKLTVTAEDIAPEVVASRLQQQFAPMAKDRGLAFPVIVADGAPQMLHTDTQRVEQILKSLLSNAFKFTERGSVTLRVYRPDEKTPLQRPSLDRANSVAFSVVDTGIGIEASKFKDIFEAFQQEDGSIDRHYGGTGLGLTIARKFAHMLGGEIHVVSQKGRGSCFTLVLPISLARAESDETPTFEERVTPDPTRIALRTMPKSSIAEFIADDRNEIKDNDKVLLVIEDDPAFAKALTKIARKRGYKCLAAGDGRNGLMLAVEQPVTAIILDLLLPDIDGVHVLDQLKLDLRTRHIPVHIVSGRKEDDTVPLRKGAIGYLTKPVDSEALDGLFAKIDRMLQTGTKRLLVVEDDQKTQVAIQRLLKNHDLQITFTSSGRGALTHISETKFDCMVLDLRLPDMSGFEVLERMEVGRGESATPPVIVYTAQDLSEDENRKLNAYTGSIIIKGAKSPERLLDEVTLFLHSVESTLSADQQEMIRMQHDPDMALHGRTILLVDDDLRNTFALSKLLRKHGMNIVIADNGQMALERLESDKSIELIIMDVMMPIMDGYQAMREIRAQKSLSLVPIIALTARAMPEEQEKCIAAGANDYLTKPVDVERLLTLLRVWLFRQELAA